MNKEIAHHIAESKELLEKGRFTIQEYREQMDFLMGDMWLVMERLDSIAEILKEDNMISWEYILQMKDSDGNVFITNEVKESISQLFENQKMSGEMKEMMAVGEENAQNIQLIYDPSTNSYSIPLPIVRGKYRLVVLPATAKFYYGEE